MMKARFPAVYMEKQTCRQKRSLDSFVETSAFFAQMLPDSQPTCYTWRRNSWGTAPGIAIGRGRHFCRMAR